MQRVAGGAQPRGARMLCEVCSIGWFFFFQAEDGIRDLTVTGVQTCALPIWSSFSFSLISTSLAAFSASAAAAFSASAFAAAAALEAASSAILASEAARSALADRKSVV